MVDLPAGRQGGSQIKMFFVYILQSIKDKKFYTGITDNIARRLEEHNRGKKSTPSTSSRGPFKLVYYEEYISRNAAREREKFLKSGAGREWRKQLL
jgi:putative endonuclease